MADVNDRRRSGNDRAETPWLAIAFVTLGIFSGVVLYVMEHGGTLARTAENSSPTQQGR